MAKTYLNDFEDYEKAYSQFEALSKEHPYEPEVWWGLILSITKKFTEFEIDYNGNPFVDLDLCDEYFDKYLKVEKDINKKEQNTKEYLTFKESLEQEVNVAKDEKKTYENDIINIIAIIVGIILSTIILIGFFMSI